MPIYHSLPWEDRWREELSRCHKVSGKKWGKPSQERTSWCPCLQEAALLVLLPSEKTFLGDWIPGGEKSKWPKLAQGLTVVVGEGERDQENPRDTPPPYPSRGRGHSQFMLQAHVNVQPATKMPGHFSERKRQPAWRKHSDHGGACTCGGRG